MDTEEHERRRIPRAVDRGRYEKGEGPVEHTEGKPQGARIRQAEARTGPLAGGTTRWCSRLRVRRKSGSTDGTTRWRSRLRGLVGDAV